MHLKQGTETGMQTDGYSSSLYDNYTLKTKTMAYSCDTMTQMNAIPASTSEKLSLQGVSELIVSNPTQQPALKLRIKCLKQGHSFILLYSFFFFYTRDTKFLNPQTKRTVLYPLSSNT